MSTRRKETVLVVAATALFVWGLTRAVNRGEPAIHSWTTFVMVGLIILSSLNINFQSRKIAVALMWVCGLFSMIVLLAAILSVSDGKPQKLFAVFRALTFFVLVGTSNYLNAKLSKENNVGG